MHTNLICELVVMKDCNNDAVLNKEECNAVISKYNIICFLTAVMQELYNLFNMYMFVDLESE